MKLKDSPNAETLESLEEVKLMKENPSIGRTYTDVDAMMEELFNDRLVTICNQLDVKL